MDGDVVKSKLTPLVRGRAVVKRKITNLFSKIQSVSDPEVVRVHSSSILGFLKEIEDYDKGFVHYMNLVVGMGRSYRLIKLMRSTGSLSTLCLCRRS